ncbi:metal ABC transporter permease [Actinoplanes bogorensis]|uniref:Metal ABC transporter permease n=1 Tax=Paractinoplanes bogorensis TaxID=1610840 RepID=A0ABS5YJ75_9ACTN|nr:metal ABC transporter permease [Actinoplanes bogorensis]MBU2663406.1 metal ABC transporter permease [Actinoplanes bogorensis]
MSWWDDALHRAVVEIVLAGALAAIIGVQVVVRKLSFFTMALTHATFPGVVAASLIGVNIFVGGLVAGAVVALAVAALGRRPGQNSAAATGVVLSAGFALGAGLVATQDGFSRDLSSFLVGSILTVDTQDLIVTAVMLVVVSALLLVCARPFLYGGFDRSFSGRWDIVLMLAIEAVVVTVVPAVGTILAVSLIVAPAAAARLWSDRIPMITGIAVGIGITGGLGGLWISYQWNVAAGASIALSVTILAAVAAALRRAIQVPTGPPSSRQVTTTAGLA